MPGFINSRLAAERQRWTDVAAIKQYDLVRVVKIRDTRFQEVEPTYERHPLVGDIGTVVEVYSDPPGFEVELCAREDGVTTWLEALHPDEVEAAG